MRWNELRSEGLSVSASNRQPRSARAKEKKSEPEVAKKPEAKGKTSVRVAIALIGVLGSVLVALIKGYFDYIHIDPRLGNLGPIDAQHGLWSPECDGFKPWDLNIVDDKHPNRSYFIPVSFPREFTKAPQVFVSVYLLDAVPSSSGLHWKLDVEDVTTKGFKVLVSAQDSSVINLIEGHWFAYQQPKP